MERKMRERRRMNRMRLKKEELLRLKVLKQMQMIRKI